MDAHSRAWAMAVACSALVLIIASVSIAQTSSRGAMQQEMTKQKSLMSDGSRKIMDASKKMQEAMSILETKKDYSKASQLIIEAYRTMVEGEKLTAYAERIDTALLQDLRQAEEAGRPMIKGAKLMRNGLRMITEDEQALSRARKITREAHGMSGRGKKIVTALQL